MQTSHFFKFSNLLIPQRLNLGTFLNMLFVLIVAGIGIYGLHETNKSHFVVHELDESRRVVGELGGLISGVSEDLFRFIVTEEKEEKTGLILAEAENFQTTFDHFRDIAIKYNIIEDLLFAQEYEPVLYALREAIVKTIGFQKRGETVEAREHYLKEVKPWANRLEGFIEESLYTKNAVIQQAVNDIETFQRDVWLYVGIAFVLILLFNFALNRSMSASITSPLLGLLQATKDIAKGELMKRVDIVSRDEIGELASSFNAMTQSIQDKNEELQTFNEELKSTTEELEATNEKLKSSNEELEAASEEIRETQDKLLQQEKLAAVGQLASGIGHELRNPLGVLKNAVYYIKTKIPQDDEKLAKHLKIMEKEIDNSTKIIGDLLGFSRTRKPDIAPNDIHRVIDDALSTVEVPANVRISKTFGQRLPQAMVDPDQIRQVFLNLALNAIQAMNEGGILTVVTRQANSTIEIQFKDTGSGIPQENLKKLFDPFFTTKARGVGLGLAVSHGIIERHQGKIEVQSTVGKGTTFTVLLPVG